MLFASMLMAQKADLTGKWEAHTTHEGRAQTYTFTFDAKGDTFTGTWQSLGSDAVRPLQAGKISGDRISFKTLRKDGTDGVLFTGTLAGDNLELTMNNLGEGERREMTAVRKKGS